MSPDSTTTTTVGIPPQAEGPHGRHSEPAASPSAPAPAPTTESAPSAPVRLNSLAEAFRQSPEALNGSASPRETDGRSSDSGPSGESTAPAVSKPEGDADRLSRRGAAAKISEQQQEIDRLVAEREAERAKSAELEAASAQQARARAERATAALSRIGSDKDFAELSGKRMRGEVLSYEQDEQLNGMLAWREHAADLWEIADRAHKQAIVAGLADAVERHGLDKTVAYDAALPELIEHVVGVTEARVRRDVASEVAELKAELKGLRTAHAGGRAPTVGGASTPGGVSMPPDGASPFDYFRAGAAQAEQAARARAASRR